MTILAVRPAVDGPTEEPVVKDGPDFAKSGGMIPVVAQDAATGEVLMLAFMNDEAWRETLRTGRACYYSRSRDRLWRKGEESGHFQEVREIRIDCDRDTVVLKVVQHGGAACHTGHRSCFFRRLEGDDWQVEGVPVFDPDVVYGAAQKPADKTSSGGRA